MDRKRDPAAKFGLPSRLESREPRFMLNIRAENGVPSFPDLSGESDSRLQYQSSVEPGKFFGEQS